VVRLVRFFVRRDPLLLLISDTLALPARAARKVSEVASETGLRSASRHAPAAPAPLSRDADAQREGRHVWPPRRTVAPWVATAWPVACGCHP